MADVRDNSKQVELRTTGSASLSNVTAATSSTQLVAANTSRRALLLFNDSTAIAYVNFGGTASTTAFTVKMQPGDYYEMPLPVFTGAVNAIWAAANGAMRVTEL